MTGHLAGGRPAWLVRAREPWAAYPVLAGAALVVGAILALRGREPAEIVLGSGFGVCFLALAWSDLRRRVLRNRLVYPALVLAIAVSGAWPDRGVVEALTGGLGALTVAIAIRGLSGGGLGGGDVKMVALVGAVVGYPGVLSAGFWAALAGGVTAAVLLVTRRAGRGDRVPYGPFIALGAVAALLG